MTSQFPQEILIEILSKLPAKAVGKCRCVSKPWNNLLSSPEFTSKTHQENLILISPSRSLHTMPIQLDGFSRNLELLPDNLAAIVGSFDGLVLLTNEEDENFLVNPITLQKVRVPDSPLALYKPGSFSMHGFGYDSSSDDYKIVTLSYFDTDNEYEPDCADTFVDVYSVKRGVWKRVDTSPYDHAVPDLASGAFVNGAIHWLASGRDQGSGCPSVIAAFNLAREVFDEIPAPRGVDGGRFVFNKLVTLGGCLCMVDSIGGDGIDVWIMREYGLVDSWTKFSINGESGRDLVKPLCYVGDGEVVFLTEDESLVLYDPISGTIRDMIVNGVPAEFLDGGTFVESLVSPVFGNHV